MGLEIERRFLVAGTLWRRHVAWQRRLQQGYLVGGSDGLTLRVRLSGTAEHGQDAWLTLKAPPATACSGPDGLVRQEFEYAIPLADAEALLALAPHQLSKWRYGLALPGGDWVVDVFEGGNRPLVVAEVELAAVDQALALPDWCVLELTGRHQFSNAALARTPFSSWPASQRDPLLRALQADGQTEPGAGAAEP